MAFPKWTVWPIAAKWAVVPGVAGVALLLLAVAFAYRASVTAPSEVSASTIAPQTTNATPAHPSPPNHEVAQKNQGLGPRQELSYDRWVKLLAQEAKAVAQKPPEQLYVLAGDSLSLWFPGELLPTGVTWLNQGISGETSYGLLRRVKFLDKTKPQVIFVMIGINDLIRGFRYETVAANHREIIRHLKNAHPKARIVVQSILPHGGERARKRYLASMKDDPAPEQNALPLWVKRLQIITNPSIQRLNQRIALIAQAEKVQFLDLHAEFADAQGDLREDLTTDGLHLSPAGYAMWRSLLEPFLPN